MTAAQDASLRAWGDELRRRRLRGRRRIATALGCVPLALFGASIGRRTSPILVWNVSASAPIGLYSVASATPPHVGDMVIAWPPAPVRALAATRFYLPANVPLVKRIAAGPGDRICAIGHRISVDGAPVATRADADPHGRPLPSWTGCRRLRPRQYLLLMRDVPGSFDGRYFGISIAADILGRARPLWVR